MEEKTKRDRGRPSKGPRHAFTVKLDLERSAKLKEILSSLGIAGTDYLGSIIKAHVDAVDLRQVGNEPLEEEALAAVKTSVTADSQSAVQRKLTPGEVLWQEKMLAWKNSLRLKPRVNEPGKP